MWIQIAGHATYILIALSYVVRDIIWLRSFAIVASCTSIAFNFFAPDEPLWLVINWNFVFLGINIFRIVRMLTERRGIRFSEDERELAETVFVELTPIEFMQLLRISSWDDAEAGATLIEQGEAVSKVMLLFSGEVALLSNKKKRGTRRPGNFVGEMSFISQKPATATVKVVEATRYLAIPQDRLRQLIAREPSLGIKLHRILSADLTSKLSGEPQSGGPVLGL